MARLIRQYSGVGLLDCLKDAVARAPPENVPENICRAFLAETDGYWAGHYDIGRGARNLTACLIGRARAEEIAVNVLLPFCAALPHAAGLRQIAIEVFRAFPAGEDNAILRHMRRQTGLESVVMTARRQQGLLHVYKRFCTQGRCRSCLLKPERTAQA
jgi:hypothetical protein